MKNLCQSIVRHIKIKLIIIESMVSNVFKQRNKSGIFALTLGQNLQNHIPRHCLTGPDNFKITQQNKSSFSIFYQIFVIVSPFHLILYHVTSAVERVFSNKWRIKGKDSFRNGRRLLRICCDSVRRTWPLFGPTDKCCFLSLSSPSSHVPYSCSFLPLAFLISFSI